LGEQALDLEEFARESYRQGISTSQIKAELVLLNSTDEEATAIVQEIKNTESIPDGFLKDICEFPKTGFSAGSSGLGCRGLADFKIHRKLAEIIGETGAAVDATDQDDAGVIKTESGFITASVDGMHSRLSHFPFLAGFHAARAAVRDVIVMGANPVALLADIHIANDGDIGKIMDYTAGASTLSELLRVPLIGGSTLRIGGDMVKGDRLTGCMIAIGVSKTQTPRHNATPGDLLIMTEGSGGGTITTTALYHGHHEVVLETLNIKSMQVAMKLNSSGLLESIHSMTDITNGGIRGDAHEFGASAKARVIIDELRVRELISTKVLHMLDELKIDPLGISIDALLFATVPENSGKLLEFLGSNGLRAQVVGRMEEGSGVYVEAASADTVTGDAGHRLNPIKPRSREAPYTPLKEVIDRNEIDITSLQNALESAKIQAQVKKAKVVEWMRTEQNK